MVAAEVLLTVIVALVNAQNCNVGGTYTSTDRAGILQVHNTLRSSIAKGTFTARTDKKPPATNMRQMTWSCDLEKSAQEAANKCQFQHTGGKYGENIYMKSSTASLSITGTGAEASKAWQNEFQQFGWSGTVLTMSEFNKGIGHATQMAWWNSNQIGCGAAQCRSGNMNQVLVFCQYLAQGNIINYPIYNSGSTCSACGSGFKCDSNSGLCVQA